MWEPRTGRAAMHHVVLTEPVARRQRPGQEQVLEAAVHADAVADVGREIDAREPAVQVAQRGLEVRRPDALERQGTHFTLARCVPVGALDARRWAAAPAQAVAVAARPSWGAVVTVTPRAVLAQP